MCRAWSRWHVYTGVRKLEGKRPLGRPLYRWEDNIKIGHYGLYSSATWSGIIYDFRTSLREFFDSVVDRITRKTLLTVNRKHFFMNIICIESFCPQEKKRTEFGSSVVHPQARSRISWIQSLNMRMRVCYLDCHEAGLCCYPVVHIENPLRQLQLFYFRSWPIY
jgi:hypothetical protein